MVIKTEEGISVTVTKAGRKYTAPCPFHEETSDKTSTFFVDLDKARYECFGCGKKGKVVEVKER
jgi:DNA primase